MTKEQRLTRLALSRLEPPTFLNALHRSSRLPEQTPQGVLVRCNCFEKGLHSPLPFPASFLEKDVDGWLRIRQEHRSQDIKQHDCSTAVREIQFQEWKRNACSHPDMTLLSSSFEKQNVMALESFVSFVIANIEGLAAPYRGESAILLLLKAVQTLQKTFLRPSSMKGHCRIVSGADLQELDAALSKILTLLTIPKQPFHHHGKPDCFFEKAWTSSFGDKELHFSTSPKASLFQSESHTIGVCEMGVFIKERLFQKPGKVIFLGKSLPFFVADARTKDTTKRSFSLSGALFRSLDLQTDWHALPGVAALDQSVEGVLRVRKTSTLEAALPLLESLQEAVGLARRHQQVMTWLF